MLIPRVIATLLLTGSSLTKTRRFRARRYVGDVINAVRIFNEKEVDEILVLDIDATRLGRGPQTQLIRDIAGECFMPLAYGGGISSLQQADALFNAGVEKVVLNSAAVKQPQLITTISAKFGSQSVVVCIDCGRDLFGRPRTFINGGRRSTSMTPVEHARMAEHAGAGELIVNSIGRDGTRKGYDLALVREVSAATTIPVIALGGAGTLQDFKAAIDNGASAVAAGSMFVFHGRRQAVLITYPDRHELESLFATC